MLHATTAATRTGARGGSGPPRQLLGNKVPQPRKQAAAAGGVWGPPGGRGRRVAPPPFPRARLPSTPPSRARATPRASLLSPRLCRRTCRWQHQVEEAVGGHPRGRSLH